LSIGIFAPGVAVANHSCTCHSLSIGFFLHQVHLAGNGRGAPVARARQLTTSPQVLNSSQAPFSLGPPLRRSLPPPPWTRRRAR
jgi:hypothetical protein